MKNIQEIAISKIHANPYQPRQEFEQAALNDLANSIKLYGILQPLLVNDDGNGYTLIAGERRLRAAQLAGLNKVPCVIGDYNDKQKAEIALIENLQRQNLNFFEEAEAMERLLKEFKVTQEQLAQHLGKSQSAIANKLRLLKLDVDLREELVKENLTERHARALLKLPKGLRSDVLDHVALYQFNVAQTEDYIARIMTPKEPTHRSIVANDLRIYLNSFKKLAETMTKGGVKTTYSYKVQDNDVVVTMRFPNKKPR